MKILYSFLALFLLSSCAKSSAQEPQPIEKNLPVFYIYGVGKDTTTQALPGIILAGGGTDNNKAMTWFVQQANADSLSKVIRRAEALFMAGGDQSNYMNFWKGTKVEEAIKYLINEKKVTIGGTSAGMAVLSEICYTGENSSVSSAEALENPYGSGVTLAQSFIDLPLLKGVVTDMHYAERSRQGRHLAFMARMVKDMGIPLAAVRGIACDEKTALCVDENGVGYVFGANAYFISATGTAPETCKAGEKLVWNASGKALTTYIIKGDTEGSNSFNLNTWLPVKDSQKEYWYVADGVLHRSATP